MASWREFWEATVDSLITHTPRDRPKGMRYEGVCVIGEVDLYGSEI